MKKENKGIPFIKLENGNNLVKVEDIYGFNNSDEEFVELTDEVLEALNQQKRYEEKYKKWEKRHRANDIFLGTEDFSASLGLYEESFETESDISVLLEEALSAYSKAVLRVAKMYYLCGVSARKIAELENLHHSTVDQYLKYAKKSLCKMLRNFLE